MTESRGIGLSAAQLAAAFPFHFAMDRDGRLAQVGPSLQKLGAFPLGSLAADHVQAQRPHREFVPATLFADAPSFLVLSLREAGIFWRGQTMAVGEHLLFLGTPWCTAAEQLQSIGLSLQDFAPHDAIVDYLTLLQAMNTALGDANQLATRLRSTHAQLTAQFAETERVRTRLEALVEQVPWGVLVEDEHGQIALANHQLCELLHLPGGPASLLGRPCADAAREILPRFADPDGFVAGITECLQAGKQVLGTTLATVDGRVLERDYVPIHDAKGFRGHLWQYRDITERQIAHQMLQEATQRAEAANRAKSDFLAMMSHEMRTPLGVIVGVADLLRQPLPTAQREAFLERLAANSRSLLRLIEDTLEFARLEHGLLRLEPQPYAPRELAEEVAAALAHQASAAPIDIVVHIDHRVPATVRGDEQRVRQVLVNLLGNALKFTTGSEVLLRVQPTEEGLDWTVADRGPGIAPADQGRVFERFVRVAGATTTRGQGTGLGLAIARELCQAMGGRLTLVSALGEGSAFTASLPVEVLDGAPQPVPPAERPVIALAVTSPWRRAALHEVLLELGLPSVEPGKAPLTVREDEVGGLWLRTSASAGEEQRLETFRLRRDLRACLARTGSTAAPTGRLPALHGGRLLLVEDDPDSAAVTSMVLERDGWVVEIASHGREAITCLRRSIYDLMITDLRMPDIDGPGLVTWLREFETRSLRSRLPVVVLSADAGGERELEAQAAGVDQFLTKPQLPAALCAVVHRHADRRPIVLVCDDDDDLRTLHSLQLRSVTQVRVATAPNADAALAMLGGRPPLLALVDHDLPGRSGPELVGDLLRLGCVHNVVLTGHDAPAVHADCMAAGASEVLVKPLLAPDLLRLVRRCLTAGPAGP